MMLAVAVYKRPGKGVMSIYQVTVWDVTTGKIARTLPESTNPAFAVSPDGRTLASYVVKVVDRKYIYRDIRLCRLLTGESVGAIDPAKRALGLAFTADSKTLIGLGGSIAFWDVSNGSVLRELKRPPRRTYGSWALSADGSEMACAIHQGEEVALWDLGSGRAKGQLTFEQRNRVLNVAFAPDLKSFACRQNENPKIRWLTNLAAVE
jgi:WD40 repeat protein